MSRPPTDIIGLRGERLAEMCLTEHRQLGRALFRPAFLGDKWPAIDLYVELLDVRSRRPHFFAQVRATTAGLSPADRQIRVGGRHADVTRLLEIPGPTYLMAVHEPSGRVFIRSVHRGTPVRAMTRVPVTHELTASNLRRLYSEVRRFWSRTDAKPATSEFP